MSKNLKTVQTIFKVLGIIWKVVYILCIVGAVASLVGLTLASVFNYFPEIAGRIEDESDMTIMQIIGYCLSGVIICIAQIILAKAHRDYFAMEQQVGTPFTEEGAKSFRTLGIMNIVIPVVTMVIVAIISAIFKSRDVEMYAGLGIGVTMILLSFVFAYGAELENKPAKESKEIAETEEK